MRRLATVLSTLALVSLGFAPTAMADFGLKGLDVEFTDEGGSPAMQAGAHPYEMTTSIAVNTRDEGGVEVIDGAIRNLEILLPAGFAGNPTAVPRCKVADFLDVASGGNPACASSTAVGVTSVTLAAGLGTPGTFGPLPIYNLTPGPGTAAKLGFVVTSVPIMIDLGVSTEAPYRVTAKLLNISQQLEFLSSSTTVWGNPANPAHNGMRGICVRTAAEDSCAADIPVRPFNTMPRSCRGPLLTTFRASAWWSGTPSDPGPQQSDEGQAESHDDSVPPSPLGTTGCEKLAFGPGVSAVPTSKAASSPSGLDFSLDIEDEGLDNPAGIANADIEKAVVTLPEGFSTNPSIAEGLEVCTEAQLDAETPFSAPGAGCPNAAKVGTVEVETPLLEDEIIKGSLYVAEPYENPFNSLLALYIVIKDPELGISVIQAAKVTPDPVTGQLTTTTEDMPQLPFSHFRLHFREGTRSPLATPPGCGVYDGHDPAHEPVRATLYPSSGGEPIESTAAFSIVTGPDAGPCPSGGLPPFKPGLIAGTLNNAAGRFSPFNLRLSRTDSEQEFTRFSIKLPPGIVGILAGIPYCPEAAIAQAKARTGPLGGHEELADPSCPAASEIGHTLAGAGVGPSLAYAPGKIYLAGPYNGSAISMVAITAGVVGPFDIGTVVIRQAFKVDRETAEVFIDSTGSDPIPHIIKGIPVHARDIRAYVDRSKFVFNPTSCERTSTASTLLGSGLDFGSAHDDRPVTVSTPFQAADCAALKFDPKLKLALKGGTKRGDHPAFRAELRMNGGPEKGEANIARAQVTLPKSAFLENAHIKTICTRVQFRANQCPAGSVYGYARAFTPVLAEPLEGPVYLRSSEHQLPDLVASLHHEKITVDVVGRIDSLKGRIRNTFEAVPDAPVSKFVLTMRGGKKGLIVNSTNLCKGTHKAIAAFTAQNGKEKNFRPAVTAKCAKAKKSKRQRRAAR